MALALSSLQQRKRLKRPVLTGMLGAVSMGIVEGRAVLDLDYIEDSAAEVDMNVVRNGAGEYVEIQGTAETRPFSREGLDRMLALADHGIDQLMALQREAIGAEALEKLIRQ